LGESATSCASIGGKAAGCSIFISSCVLQFEKLRITLRWAPNPRSLGYNGHVADEKNELGKARPPPNNAGREVMDIKKLILIEDKEQFETELTEALGDEFDALPLEDACEDGGFPDPISVDVYDVKKTGEDENFIYATFGVSFTEEINTSCGDVTISKPRNMDCTVTIDKVLGEADFTVEKVESDWEF
jgi:hypothetical protein